jgi:hypothetical protein
MPAVTRIPDGQRDGTRRTAVENAAAIAGVIPPVRTADGQRDSTRRTAVENAAVTAGVNELSMRIPDGQRSGMTDGQRNGMTDGQRNGMERTVTENSTQSRGGIGNQNGQARNSKGRAQVQDVNGKRMVTPWMHSYVEAPSGRGMRRNGPARQDDREVQVGLSTRMSYMDTVKQASQMQRYGTPGNSNNVASVIASVVRRPMPYKNEQLTDELDAKVGRTRPPKGLFRIYLGGTSTDVAPGAMRKMMEDTYLKDVGKIILNIRKVKPMNSISLMEVLVTRDGWPALDKWLAYVGQRSSVVCFEPQTQTSPGEEALGEGTISRVRQACLEELEHAAVHTKHSVPGIYFCQWARMILGAISMDTMTDAEYAIDVAITKRLEEFEKSDAAFYAGLKGKRSEKRDRVENDNEPPAKKMRKSSDWTAESAPTGPRTEPLAVTRNEPLDVARNMTVPETRSGTSNLDGGPPTGRITGTTTVRNSGPPVWRNAGLPVPRNHWPVPTLTPDEEIAQIDADLAMRVAESDRLKRDIMARQQVTADLAAKEMAIAALNQRIAVAASVAQVADLNRTPADVNTEAPTDSTLDDHHIPNEGTAVVPDDAQEPMKQPDHNDAIMQPTTSEPSPQSTNVARPLSSANGMYPRTADEEVAATKMALQRSLDEQENIRKHRAYSDAMDCYDSDVYAFGLASDDEEDIARYKKTRAPRRIKDSDESQDE